MTAESLRQKLMDEYKAHVEKGVVSELAFVESLIALVCEQRQALEFYTNYDKETVRHMDTEWLKPQNVAVIKPLDKIQNHGGMMEETDEIYCKNCLPKEELEPVKWQ